MFEKVLGRSLRLSQCRLDGDRSCDFEAKPVRPPLLSRPSRLTRLRNARQLPSELTLRSNRALAKTSEYPESNRLMSKVLSIENLHVAIQGKEILRGVDLTLKQGEVHALMGPNGSGKSTLSYALMGHPNYEVTAGSITLDGVDLLAWTRRAGQGGHLPAFQYPTSFPGCRSPTSCGTRSRSRNPSRKEGEDLIPMRDFRKELREQMDELGVDQEFARRYLNDGFSGGEKKRAEIFSSPCSAPPSPSSMRPIAASISMPSGSSRKVSPGSRLDMRPAFWSSRTTSGS